MAAYVPDSPANRKNEERRTKILGYKPRWRCRSNRFLHCNKHFACSPNVEDKWMESYTRHGALCALLVGTAPGCASSWPMGQYLSKYILSVITPTTKKQPFAMTEACPYRPVGHFPSD